MHKPFDIVIYHGNCYDGFTAAWVAKRHSPDATFVAAQYGDAPPNVAGKRVLVVDFSYPRDVLLGLRSVAECVIVLDHHKTAQADLEGLPDVVFDMERSGAGITWDVLFPGQPRPWLVKHVEDRDLWRFALLGTREIHAALTLVPFDFAQWSYVAVSPIEELRYKGEIVRRYVELTAEKLALRSRIVSLIHPDHAPAPLCRVRAVNVPVELVSETAEVLKLHEPHLPILGWSWDGERCNYYCSLRSRTDGPDVSAIARIYGGGGHQHAAGFRCAQLPFDPADSPR